MNAPELSDREREIVARFEASPVLAEAWCCEGCAESTVEMDPFAVGSRVDVFPVPGGYVVAPAGSLDEDAAQALADAARPVIEEQS